MTDRSGSSPPLDRRDALWFLALGMAALYLFGWGTGSYALWDPWEPKYAQAMRETMDRGEIITPYLGDKIRWTKPILIYWAMYVPILIGGNNEFTVRLPSVLAGVLGVLLIYYFLRRLRGRPTAVMGAAILMTLPQYYYMARQAMPDMMLTMFLGAGMGFLALGRFAPEHKRLHFYLFYAAVALAFLTKGPVAPVIVLGAIAIFWVIDVDPARLRSPRTIWFDFKQMLSSYHVVRGVVVFVVIAGPWYVAMLIKHRYAFIENFILDENLDRFTDTVRRHHGISTHYLQAIFHGMYPWIGLLLPSIVFYFQGARQLTEEVRQRWYYLSWFICIFLLFTVAGTKIDHYILPITVSLAVLVALAWEEYLKPDAAFWVRPVFLLSVPFLYLPVRDFITESSKYLMDIFTSERSIRDSDTDLALWIVFGCWALVMLLSAVLRRSRLVALLAVLVAFGNAVYFSHQVLPTEAKYRSLKMYIDYYEDVEDPKAELLYYGNRRYSMFYYYDKEKLQRFNRRQARTVARFVRNKPNVYIILQEKYEDYLIAELNRGAGPKWYSVFGDNEHPIFRFITNDTRLDSSKLEPFE